MQPVAAELNAPQVARILLVIGDLGFGGAERGVITLVNGLVKRGLDVHVATFSGLVPLASELVEPSRLHVLRGSVLALIHLARTLQTRVMHGFLLDAEILVCLAAWACKDVVVLGSERSSRHHYRLWQRLLYRLSTQNMQLCIAN
ncbi:MAG: glycosyltransferase [Gammaproteobacteria bacterium]|nr:glycosyltransferase [Gammaproteobacteria bacterium]